MATITPTIAAQKWGPKVHQIFGYYAHPTRDAGGNPCLVFRHGGGGWGSNYTGAWVNLGGNGHETMHELFEYMHETDRSVHFDIISVETAQVLFLSNAQTVIFSTIPRSVRSHIGDAVFDLQRAVCAIKRWGMGWNNTTAYRINPNKIIGAGQSWGATVWGLSQIRPPISGDTQRTPVSGRYEASGYNSRVAGVIYQMGTIDCRKSESGGTVNYMAPQNQAAWFGCDQAADTEYDSYLPASTKENFSLRAYIQNGDTAYWVPHMFIYNPFFATSAVPHTDAHDPVQKDDIATAIKTYAPSLKYSVLDAGTSNLNSNISGGAIRDTYVWARNVIENIDASVGYSVPVLR